MPVRQDRMMFRLVAGGDYADVVRMLDDATSPPDADDLPWIVAALTLVGRTCEAEGLFAAREGTLPVALQIASRFFLAVAYCREGRSHKARQLLVRNRADARASTDMESRFFAAQGFAFYRYASGRLPAAELWAQAALKATGGAGFIYGSVLALELLGHVQLSAGAIRAGFRSLALARTRAEALGQGALLQAMAVSQTLYRSTYGLPGNAAAVASELEGTLAACRFEDSYTRAQVTLELARARILQGRLSDAKALVQAASELVYRIDNPDLEIDHNVCLASLLRRQGEPHQALSLIRGARHRARTRQDARPLLRVLGLEAQLLGDLGRLVEQDALAAEIASLTRRTGGIIGARILERALGTKIKDVRPGEDPLGDLIADAHRYGAEAVPTLLRSGWHGLLGVPLGVLPTDRILYFDLEPGTLTIFDRGDVTHVEVGCSDFMRKLIVALSAGECSKETLAIHLWGRSYNPLRHDGLIYGLVGKTRRLLGHAADWIEACEVGYRLKGGIRVVARNLRGNTDVAPAAPAVDPKLSSQMNIRQVSILDWLRDGEIVDARAAMARLGISDATASRDLTQLVQLGLACRVGKGRATKYAIAPDRKGGANKEITP